MNLGARKEQKHPREVTGKLLGYQGLEGGSEYSILGKNRNQEHLEALSRGCGYLPSGAGTPKMLCTHL